MKFRKKRKGPIGSFVSYLLSLLFKGGVHLRHFAYDRGWISPYYSELPVISVGNIAVGGTGKTPLVQLLAQELGKQVKIGILSRGYGRKTARGILKVSTGGGPLVSSKLSGDEPYLLAQKTNAHIFVGKNRVEASKLAEECDLDALILDDGMQHRKLARDFEIVVIDAEDPVGGNRFLPKGSLRETPKRLFFADLIVLTHVRDEEHFESVKALLRDYTKAPCVGSRHSLQGLFLESKTKVAAFCGIGNPEYFYQMLENQGLEIVEKLTLPDHSVPKKAKLTAFIEKSCLKGAAYVLCTEKDAVKLDPKISYALPIQPLAAALTITQGFKEWDQALDKMKQKVML